MEGHKKKFRKSLWLGMAYNGERGTETPIALTTTTTFSTTTALRNTMTWTRSSTSTRSSVGPRCGPDLEENVCSDGMDCVYLGYCTAKRTDFVLCYNPNCMTYPKEPEHMCCTCSKCRNISYVALGSRGGEYHLCNIQC